MFTQVISTHYRKSKQKKHAVLFSFFPPVFSFLFQCGGRTRSVQTQSTFSFLSFLLSFLFCLSFGSSSLFCLGREFPPLFLIKGLKGLD